MNSGSATSRSPSGQWYPQNASWQSGSTVPAQYSPSGTPPVAPGGGFGNMNNMNMMNMQQQQQQQQRNMNTSGMLNNSGTWNATSTPMPPGFGGGMGGPGMPGMMPGQPGMMPGQPGMYPGMNGMMMQPQQGCCDCCGNQQGGGCCGNQQGGGCCGGPQQGGCCPMPGEPPNPFVCESTPMNPACYECIYNCFDYSFLLMCVLFALTVVGFGVVVGTKGMDDIYTAFNASNSTELDANMRPYIRWMNPVFCNVTNGTNSSDSSSSSVDSNSSAEVPVDPSTSEAPETPAEPENSEEPAGRAAALYRMELPAVFAVLSTQPSDNETASGSETSDDSSDNETECIPMENYTKPCTERRLKGSFGPICMEDNLQANVLAVQLSQWNNARDTLWFIAMAYTGFAILFAGLIHSQRHPNPANMMMNAGGMMNPAMLPPEKQAELAQMTPQQQQQFIMEYQMQQQQLGMSAGLDASSGALTPQMQQQQQQLMLMMQQGQQSGCCGSGGLEFYETPFYEFVRFAWGFVGLLAFAWAINLCLSFWAFSTFYVNGTEGPLQEFWKKYAGKFSGSVVMVTVFLAWPLCNVALDLVVLVVGIIPWVIIRSTCKQNIGNYRPNLPVSQMPGWIRTDMFFMDFADLKRLGFSRNAWIILTGSERPFFDTCCVDPMVDTDPNMTSLLVQRYQFQLQAYAMMPPWMRGMMPPPMPPANLNMTPEQFQQQFGMGQSAMMGGQVGPGMYGNSLPQTPQDAGLSGKLNRDSNESEGAPGTGRHRRRHRGASMEASAAPIPMQDADATPGGHSSSGRHRRRNHADPAGDDTGAGEVTPSRRKHRSRSRSKAAGNAAETPSGHRRRSRSRSMSKEVAVPIAEGAAGEESKSRRHRKHGEDAAAAEGASRSRRHSSRSRSRSKGKGNKDKKDKKEKKSKDPGADLDDLMNL